MEQFLWGGWEGVIEKERVPNRIFLFGKEKLSAQEREMTWVKAQQCGSFLVICHPHFPRASSNPGNLHHLPGLLWHHLRFSFVSLTTF